jgi:tyrosyl-tRNA synthetase
MMNEIFRLVRLLKMYEHYKKDGEKWKMPVVEVKEGEAFSSILSRAFGISKSEAFRKIKEGAIELNEDEKISENRPIRYGDNGDLYIVGKLRVNLGFLEMGKTYKKVLLIGR